MFFFGFFFWCSEHGARKHRKWNSFSTAFNGGGYHVCVTYLDRKYGYVMSEHNYTAHWRYWGRGSARWCIWLDIWWYLMDIHDGYLIWTTRFERPHNENEKQQRLKQKTTPRDDRNMSFPSQAISENNRNGISAGLKKAHRHSQDDSKHR